jgi:hypothetical protein
MHCSNTLLISNEKETIRLYVTNSSFVLKKNKHILEIQFDGHAMTRRGIYLSIVVFEMGRLTWLGLDSFDKKKHTVIQQYDIYGVLGFIEGFRGT